MKKTLSMLLAIICVSALLATTLTVGSLAGTTVSTAAVVELNEFTQRGTLEVKDGVLTITPNGVAWEHTYTKNLNATPFGAADDLDISFDYKLLAHEWAEVFHICVGGDGYDKQWGSVVLRLEGNGEGKADLKALTDELKIYKTVANVVVPGEWYSFRITVDKTGGLMSVYLNKKGEAAAATPVLTVTDAEHAAAGGPANFISTLSGGLNLSTCFKASQVDNVKLTAGGTVLLDDDFEPAVAPVTNLGGQLRGGAVDGRLALRFAFELPCAGVGYEDAAHTGGNYKRALSADSKVTIDGAACTVTDFGAVLSLDGGSALTVEDAENGAAVKVPALNLYDVGDGRVTYTAVVTNVPDTDGGKATPVYARPYVAYAVGGETVYVYGEIVSRCVNDILQ